MEDAALYAGGAVTATSIGYYYTGIAMEHLNRVLEILTALPL